MKENDTVEIIRKLSRGFLEKKIEGKLYAWVTESLIVCNKINLSKRYIDFAHFLAQYSPNQEIPELYGSRELKKKIKELFEL